MHPLITRRKFIKCSALAGAAVIAAGSPKGARSVGVHDPCSDTTGLTEADLTMRKVLQYTGDSPFEGKVCNNCALWLAPPPSEKCGRCTVIKGPIHPQGYCNSWAGRPQTSATPKHPLEGTWVSENGRYEISVEMDVDWDDRQHNAFLIGFNRKGGRGVITKAPSNDIIYSSGDIAWKSIQGSPYVSKPYNLLTVFFETGNAFIDNSYLGATSSLWRDHVRHSALAVIEGNQLTITIESDAIRGVHYVFHRKTDH